MRNVSTSVDENVCWTKLSAVYTIPENVESQTWEIKRDRERQRDGTCTNEDWDNKICTTLEKYVLVKNSWLRKARFTASRSKFCNGWIRRELRRRYPDILLVFQLHHSISPYGKKMQVITLLSRTLRRYRNSIGYSATISVSLKLAFTTCELGNLVHHFFSLL